MNAQKFITDRLVPPLIHGDEKHQQWLRDELQKWIPALEEQLNIESQLFDELNSLLRTFRHSVHGKHCECVACRKMLRDLIVIEQKWYKRSPV